MNCFWSPYRIHRLRWIGGDREIGAVVICEIARLIQWVIGHELRDLQRAFRTSDVGQQNVCFPGIDSFRSVLEKSVSKNWRLRRVDDFCGDGARRAIGPGCSDGFRIGRKLRAGIDGQRDAIEAGMKDGLLHFDMQHRAALNFRDGVGQLIGVCAGATARSEFLRIAEFIFDDPGRGFEKPEMRTCYWRYKSD